MPATHEQAGAAGNPTSQGSLSATPEDPGSMPRDDSAPSVGAAPPSFLPKQNAEYLHPEYWDRRFQQEEAYEWCKSYADFRHLLAPHLARGGRLLILGCGNSSLAFDLHRDGFKRLVCVDISPSVIGQMRTRAAAQGMADIEWREGDMLDLPFESASFDAVIEKGTMDVLFVDNDSPWDPRPEVRMRVKRMLDETHRVLQDDGVFMSVTFAQPHFRRPFLLAPGYKWDMEVAAFGEEFHYFVYCMRKGQRKASDVPGHFGQEAGSIRGVQESPMHAHMDQEDFLMGIEM